MPTIALATTAPGPRGPIHLAATDRGVVAIDLLAPRDEFVAGLERRLGAPPAWQAGVTTARAADHLRAAELALARFFDGDAGAFGDLALDLDDRPAWDRTVLGAVAALRPGTTASYGEIARIIGRRGAARAVGGAVGRNPISLAIPCHRVIAGDGTLGGYGGGWWGSREDRLALKRELLAREGVRLRDEASRALTAR
jgi:methylated-DNA-[protein]-cysteine S-methyltransferase